jgi:hypothetical protein
MTTTDLREPTRARAVLSTEDFRLLKQALHFYLQAHEEGEEVNKFIHLYHRLGTAARA